MIDLDLPHTAPPSRRDYGIGVVGAGFVVRDLQLVAYARPRYNGWAIACDTPDQARAVAALRGVPTTSTDVSAINACCLPFHMVTATDSVFFQDTFERRAAAFAWEPARSAEAEEEQAADAAEGSE
jgi:hypothetical protein